MTVTTAEAPTVPGVYDMPADEYHANTTALSSSGARRLLASPARFHYEQTHPKPPTKAFDLGHAAHKLALGAGPDVVVVEADDWRTKAAREAKDDAHAAGRMPVLAREWEQVREMVAALRTHRLAGPLLLGGLPEQSLWWTDQSTGVRCRAMVDYLRPPWLVDYKTCESADPRDLVRSVINYGYHLQAWWYLDGAQTLGLADRPAFLFIAQEKTPPYLVSVFQLDDEFMALGEARARLAREMYRDCTQAGVWPGYPTEVATLAPPRWLRNQEEYR